jgi:hypothetical protein
MSRWRGASDKEIMLLDALCMFIEKHMPRAAINKYFHENKESGLRAACSLMDYGLATEDGSKIVLNNCFSEFKERARLIKINIVKEIYLGVNNE